jgi:ketosteroid isomerase-like protein
MTANTPTSQEDRNLATVRAYFAAIERGVASDSLESFYAPDVIQEEYPNRLMPHGARRDLDAIREAAARGKELMRSQQFELLSVLARNHTVVAEAQWIGTVANSVGPFEAGAVIRARFAMFFELRDGRIVSQRNYDCFDPW